VDLNKTYFGDCLEVMKLIDDNSIDMVLCDLPYGVTKNKWDSVIDLDKLWSEYERVIKANGAIVLFGQDKFSAKLKLSNARLHRYNLIWEKTTPTGHLNAKKMPLRSHEDLLVFYKQLPTYNPQKTTGHERKVSTADHKRNSKKTSNYGEHGLTTYDSTERYPKSVLKFATDKQKVALHPTQKPLALMEYLIATYSNEGETILDNCAGSGTTGLAAKNLKRNYIMIENDEINYNFCIERVGEKLFKKDYEQKLTYEELTTHCHKPVLADSCPTCGHIQCLCRTPLGNFC
jgi:DNA modification methylase